ncbi:hypothetical protein KSF78_0006371 [Schistosoma japonicum]|nr:hypothetical protein KSF78_0006371 [Schistosoma japonicum]
MESYIDNSITKPTNIMHNITTLSPIPITKITRNDSGTDILWTEIFRCLKLYDSGFSLYICVH